MRTVSILFLWAMPMALLLAVFAAVLRKALGGPPGLFYAGAFLLCVAIVVWAQVWILQNGDGLESVLAWIIEVNAAVAGGLVAVAWVIHSIRAGRTRGAAEDRTNPTAAR